MDYSRYLDLLAADGGRLADAARADLDAPVPPCPGWTVRDLVTHTGQVYGHKRLIITSGSADRPGFDGPLPEPGEDVLGWYEGQLASLLEVLHGTDPARPAWTWWPPVQTVGWWARRMSQEAVIHRVDAELASGPATPVDEELAVDGIDEVLECFLSGDWSDEPEPMPGTGQRVEVATRQSRWTVTLSAQEVGFAREPGEGADVSVAGEPSDLLLWLWNRAPDEAVTASGDPAAATLLRRYLAAATQ